MYLENGDMVCDVEHINTEAASLRELPHGLKPLSTKGPTHKEKCDYILKYYKFKDDRFKLTRDQLDAVYMCMCEKKSITDDFRQSKIMAYINIGQVDQAWQRVQKQYVPLHHMPSGWTNVPKFLEYFEAFKTANKEVIHEPEIMISSDDNKFDDSYVLNVANCKCIFKTLKGMWTYIILRENWADNIPLEPHRIFRDTIPAVLKKHPSFEDLYLPTDLTQF